MQIIDSWPGARNSQRTWAKLQTSSSRGRAVSGLQNKRQMFDPSGIRTMTRWDKSTRGRGSNGEVTGRFRMPPAGAPGASWRGRMGDRRDSLYPRADCLPPRHWDILLRPGQGPAEETALIPAIVCPGNAELERILRGFG